MKKISFLALALLLLGSCATEEPKKEKEMVDVTLSYLFAESGDMSRSSDLYNTFYNNQIKSKKITPDNFTLTFTENTSGAVYTHYGKWSNNTKFAFLEGTYKVKGTSKPVNLAIDTLYLTFEEEITINKESTAVSLHAKNNCYLLAFEEENIEKINYKRKAGSTYSGISTVSYTLPCTDNIYYMVVNNLSTVSSEGNNNTLNLKYKNGDESSITLDAMPFEKGKYYIFNGLSNSFDVPAMEEGNR